MPAAYSTVDSQVEAHSHAFGRAVDLSSDEWSWPLFAFRDSRRGRLGRIDMVIANPRWGRLASAAKRALPTAHINAARERAAMAGAAIERAQADTFVQADAEEDDDAAAGAQQPAEAVVAATTSEEQGQGEHSAGAGGDGFAPLAAKPSDGRTVHDVDGKRVLRNGATRCTPAIPTNP